jgi:hypothetical protein
METALTVVFGIVSTVLAIYAIRQAKHKKPAWAYTTTRIQSANDYYRTVLIFFNRGRGVIRRDDVARDVVIVFAEAEVIQQPTVLVRSKEAIEFSAASLGSCVTLGFRYLGYNDGGVIEVLHTKSNKITCSGDIIDAEKTDYIGEFVLFASRHTRNWWAKFVLVLSQPFIVIGILAVTNVISFGSRDGLALLALAVAVYYLGVFRAKPRNFYILKKFPDWSFY